MATTTETFRDCDTDQLVAQIGRMNLAAISGLRVGRRPTGVTLPVGAGYRVEIDLMWDDTYRVARVFKRGAKTWGEGRASVASTPTRSARSPTRPARSGATNSRAASDR